MKRLAGALTAVIMTMPTIHAQDADLPSQSGGSGVGHKSVGEALASLRGTPGIEMSTTTPDGWTIANDAKEYSQWSFTPVGHYAYPAVVKRVIKRNSSGGLYIEIAALCEAEKVNCDKLIQEFVALNDRIRDNIQQRLKE
jgi:hypothetical protein